MLYGAIRFFYRSNLPHLIIGIFSCVSDCICSLYDPVCIIVLIGCSCTVCRNRCSYPVKVIILISCDYSIRIGNAIYVSFFITSKKSLRSKSISCPVNISVSIVKSVMLSKGIFYFKELSFKGIVIAVFFTLRSLNSHWLSVSSIGYGGFISESIYYLCKVTFIIIGKSCNIAVFIYKTCLLVAHVVSKALGSVVVSSSSMALQLIMLIDNNISVLLGCSSCLFYIIILIGHYRIIRKCLFNSSSLIIILIGYSCNSLRIYHILYPAISSICKARYSSVRFFYLSKTFIFIGIANRPAGMIGQALYKILIIAIFIVFKV